MRELVYDTLSTLDDIVVYDSRSLNWDSFKWDGGYRIHKLSDTEIMKPYLISAQYYGTIDYEDIILLLNNIEDIFEVAVGTEIRIPSLSELKSFVLENRK